MQCGRLGLGWTSTARTCVRRQGRTSISGTSRGWIRSLTRLANRSSTSSASGTPQTWRLRSSTPTSSVPSAVLANATIVFKAPSGEERSRLSSSVLPSGRLRISSRSATLGNILGSNVADQASELPLLAGLTRRRFAHFFKVLLQILKDKEKGNRLQGVIYDRSAVKETGARQRSSEKKNAKAMS